MTAVTFISANEGKLELYSGLDQLIVTSDDAMELAVVMDSLDLDLSGAAGSSSLDFADEYGFATSHGALDLLTQALEMRV